jgi:hypothetical protein
MSESNDEATLNKSESNVAKPKSEPNSQEQSAIVRYRVRESASAAPQLKGINKAGSTTSPEAVGSAPSKVPIGAIELADLLVTPISKDRFDLMASLLKGYYPMDPIEAMLLMQMSDIHRTAMRFAQRLDEAEYIGEREMVERALNRLARTFTAQIEALDRHRTGGAQTVSVQNLSIRGGQAIVGNVTQAPRQSAPNEAAAPAPAPANIRNEAMEIPDEPRRKQVPMKRKARK